MKRSCTSHVYSGLVRTSLVHAGLVRAGLAIAAVVAFGGQMIPAHAAPPTVTPSPGYDARLQESRAPTQTYYEPAVRIPAPVHRRHVKRVHDGAQ